MPTPTTETALTGIPVHRPPLSSPLAFERMAQAAQAVGAEAAHVGVVRLHAGDHPRAILGLDHPVAELVENVGVLEGWLSDVPGMLGISVACSPVSDPLGAAVRGAGRSIYVARQHGHPAARPLPRGLSSDDVRDELEAQLDAALGRGDASETSVLCERGVELGFYAFALLASERLLRVDDSEHSVAVRMQALNAACLHEAAELRGREYVGRNGATASVMLQLCRSVAQQRRREEAMALAEQIRTVAQRNPSLVPATTLREVERTRKSLARSAA